MYKILGIGEILWDVFPSGKKLGGAPTNFAYHVSALGHEGIIVSRIGNDGYGREITEQLTSLGLDTKYLQIDDNSPTSTVEAIIDKNNEPSYIIKENVAWDFLQWDTKFNVLLEKIDAICFGTLAQRNKLSRNTIISFLRKAKKETVKVYDINLRQSFYNKSIILDSLKFADILKLNAEEVLLIREILNINTKYNEVESCKFLLDNFDLKLVCVTKGQDGSMLVDKQTAFYAPAFPYSLADRVGAGDAFTAAVIIGYLNKEPIDIISVRANRLASWVTSQYGGTPVYDSEIKNIMNI